MLRFHIGEKIRVIAINRHFSTTQSAAEGRHRAELTYTTNWGD